MTDRQDLKREEESKTFDFSYWFIQSTNQIQALFSLNDHEKIDGHL